MTIDSLFIKLGTELEFGVSEKDLSKTIKFGDKTFDYQSEAEFADLLYDSEDKLAGVTVSFLENEALYSDLAKLNNVKVDQVKGNITVYFSPNKDLNSKINKDDCEGNFYTSIYSNDDVFAVLVYNLRSADLTEDSLKYLEAKVLN